MRYTNFNSKSNNKANLDFLGVGKLKIDDQLCKNIVTFIFNIEDSLLKQKYPH